MNADDIIPNAGVTNVSAKKAMTPMLSRTTVKGKSKITWFRGIRIKSEISFTNGDWEQVVIKPFSIFLFHSTNKLLAQLEPGFQPPISEVAQALVQLVQRANMSRRTTFGSNQGGSNRGSDVPAIHDDM
ncbi:hypothetical protein HN51_063593 [Arachis hypogaea]